MPPRYKGKKAFRRAVEHDAKRLEEPRRVREAGAEVAQAREELTGTRQKDVEYLQVSGEPRVAQIDQKCAEWRSRLLLGQ